jgi:hypothetical protein
MEWAAEATMNAIEDNALSVRPRGIFPTAPFPSVETLAEGSWKLKVVLAQPPDKHGLNEFMFSPCLDAARNISKSRSDDM